MKGQPIKQNPSTQNLKKQNEDGDDLSQLPKGYQSKRDIDNNNEDDQQIRSQQQQQIQLNFKRNSNQQQRKGNFRRSSSPENEDEDEEEEDVQSDESEENEESNQSPNEERRSDESNNNDDNKQPTKKNKETSKGGKKYEDYDEQELLSLREQQINKRKNEKKNKGKLSKKGKNRQEEPDYNPFFDDNANQKEFLMSFGSLKLCLGMILFFSLFLTVISYVGFAQTKQNLLLWVGTVALFLNFLWLIGIIAIFKVEQDLKHIYFPNLSGTFGFELLFLFFMASAIFMVIMIYLGLALQLDLRIVIESLKSLYLSPLWDSTYGIEYPLQVMTTLTKCFFQICSIVSLIIACLLFFVLTKAIKIGETSIQNRLTAFFYTFNNIIFPLLTILFLYFVLYAEDTVTDIPIIGEKFLPKFAVNSFIALCVVLFAVSLLGYISAYTESKTVLEAYGFILGFSTLLMLVYSSLLAYNSNAFVRYYDKHWGDIMLYVHQDSFSIDQMNCYGGKYFRNLNSTNLYDLKCASKFEISQLWEVDLEKDVDDHMDRYACLNLGCKDVFGSWIARKIKYLALIGFTQSFLTLIILYLAYQMWKKISHGAERTMWHDKGIEIGILFLTLMLIFIGAIVAAWGRPDGPKLFPYAHEYPEDVLYSDANKKSTQINQQFLNPNQQWFKVYGIQISEDQSQCQPECNPLEYNVTLTTSDGQIRSNYFASRDFENLSDKRLLLMSSGFMKDSPEIYWLQFSGGIRYMNQVLNDLEFKPDCPFKQTGLFINIQVFARGARGQPANGQLVSVAAGEATQIVGNSFTQVINQEVEQILFQNSGEDQDWITIKGIVYDLADNTLMQEVAVRATQKAYKCTVWASTTDVNGQFSLKFPFLNNNIPYELSVTLHQMYYKVTERIIVIGGILQQNEIQFESWMARNDQNILSFYKSHVVENKYLYPIPAGHREIELYLYGGGNSTAISTQRPVSITYPDKNGYFQFLNLSPGQYFVTSNDTKHNFAPFIEDNLYIMGDADSMKQHQRTILMNDNNGAPYKFRVVLTWTNQKNEITRDLDLFGQFQLNDKYICTVGFFLPLCEGVMTNFEGQNNDPSIQSESLTLNVIGDFTYIIYVAEWLDKSNIYQPYIEDTQARLDLYIDGFTKDGPIAKLPVPFIQTGESEETAKPYRYWAAICIRGDLTLNKIYVLNSLQNTIPNVSQCDQYINTEERG